MPGVKIVDLYRLIRSSYQGKPIVIESFSARESANVRTLPMTSGDGARALREMGEGKGVIISESFQSKFGKGVNETIDLATPSGRIAFRILGVYVDYSSDVGSVLIDRTLTLSICGSMRARTSRRSLPTSRSSTANPTSFSSAPMAS